MHVLLILRLAYLSKIGKKGPLVPSSCTFGFREQLPHMSRLQKGTALIWFAQLTHQVARF